MTIAWNLYFSFKEYKHIKIDALLDPLLRWHNEA